jgi:hypothetical protein
MVTTCVIGIALLGGCAAQDGATPARAALSPSGSDAPPAVVSSVPTALAPSSPMGAAPTDDRRPPCPSAQIQPILGPHVTKHAETVPTVTPPFGDVGVTFGHQLEGASVLSARLDVVPTVANPTIANPTGDLSSYAAAESAGPDSFQKLTAGTEPYVARVMLQPFAAGPFVVPAATLNALPTPKTSYTVYLVQSTDESACFGAPPESPPYRASGVTVIAELAP